MFEAGNVRKRGRKNKMSPPAMYQWGKRTIVPATVISWSCIDDKRTCICSYVLHSFLMVTFLHVLFGIVTQQGKELVVREEERIKSGRDLVLFHASENIQ